MKGKLYKSPNGEHYYLTVDGKIFADVDGHPLKAITQALSLKNCQAIERGYDLDELYGEVDESIDYHEFDFTSFRLGFQKALELLGDKKFSEEDLRKAMDKVWDWCKAEKDTDFSTITELRNKHIQSLQQTEWDVTFNPNEKDSDGCLILKRI